MKAKFLFYIGFFILVNSAFSQDTYSLEINVNVVDKLQSKFSEEGRLFIFLNENLEGNPYRQLSPMNSKRNHIFAKNISWNNPGNLVIPVKSTWEKTVDFSFGNIPSGKYNLQILWDQDSHESRINAPGNLYSKPVLIDISNSISIDIPLDNIIPERKLIDHELVKMIKMKSDTLSSWWGKEMVLKASVLLPSSYYNDTARKFPVRYNVAGYGGRYTRINNLITRNTSFRDWWVSEEAPQIINVFLDGEGPYGDSYQLDSENNGPYGYALIHELIPHIEALYRGTGNAEHRFVDGCSTGGWVSLALQLFYPDHFNGVWSYSPDAIEFENYQLINVYKDKNAFINEWGNLRPVARDLSGDPIVTMKQFIKYENVLGYSNDYTTSGGQFSAHNALYSPKSSNGLPTPMFDPKSGEIDKLVVEHWKKYDLKLHLKSNWEDLAPKLNNKIFIWMGDMDNFYLNPATRSFSDYLNSVKNSEFNALIEFTPMAGHCQNFDHKEILKMMEQKID